jgi:hypothetical protein
MLGQGTTTSPSAWAAGVPVGQCREGSPEHLDEGRFVWREQVMTGVQPRDTEVGDAGTAVPLGIFACQQSISAAADRERRTADRRQLIPQWHVR